ncbi:acyltransferase [Bradyrhizobium sp. CSS354]|uniref:acyltransferase family protein n=1 Tax=Bradyrhizobium sp. CSS354 TaxID=2699172 RepID=UPI0023B17747|nr:acyltransferase [Bradyrhizobium sp. CSS354]MDE5463905.1 acyltransferase family protein [Bradyrhizobium sp. CSS354]
MSKTSGEIKRNRYQSLDAMRGLASIAVAAGHFNSGYVHSSYLAVDFFFILSGFVIDNAYASKLTGGMTPVAFMWVRLVRLWPLFAIGTAIGLAQILYLVNAGLSQASGADIVISSAQNFLFLPSVSAFFMMKPMQGLFPINGPAWSLFWELVINLAFAVVLFKSTTRALCFVIVTAAVGLVAFAFVWNGLNIGWNWSSSPGGLVRVTFGFTLGLVISRCLRPCSVRRVSWLSLLPMILLVGGLVFPIEKNAQAVYDLVFCLVAAPGIVVCGMLLEVPRRIRRVAFWLGYLSYPLYVVHRGCVGLFKAIPPQYGLDSAFGFIVFLVGTASLAILISLALDNAQKPDVGHQASAG